MAARGPFQQAQIETGRDLTHGRRRSGDPRADAILANRIARLPLWQLELELQGPEEGASLDDEGDELPEGADDSSRLDDDSSRLDDACPEGMALSDEEGDASEGDAGGAELDEPDGRGAENDANPRAGVADADLVFHLVPHPDGGKVLRFWSGISPWLVRAPRERKWALARRIRDHLRLAAVLQETNEAALRAPDARIQPVTHRDLIQRLSFRKERLSHLLAESTLRTPDGRLLHLSDFVERAARPDEQVKYRAVALTFAANAAADAAGEWTETDLVASVNLMRQWLGTEPVDAEAVRKARSGLGIRTDRGRKKARGREGDFVDALRIPEQPHERAIWRERWLRALADPPVWLDGEAQQLLRHWAQRIDGL